MKNLLKLLVWLIGLLVFIAILLMVGLKLFFPMEKVRKMAVAEISERLGREVEIDNLDISIWGGLGIELQGVKIENQDSFSGQPLLKAEILDLKMRILPLIEGDIKINRLIIQSPSIVLQKKSNGYRNYVFQPVEHPDDHTAVPDIQGEVNGMAGVISFDEFEIHDGNLVYIDDSLGRRVDISGLTVSTQLETLDNGSYGSTGRIQAESIKLSDSIVVQPLTVSLTYNTIINTDQKFIQIEKGDIRVNDILLKLTGNLTNLIDAPAFSGNVKITQQQIDDILRLIPEDQREAISDLKLDGDISLDLDIEFSNADTGKIDYNGQVILSDFAMSKEGLKGELRFSRSLIDIQTNRARINIEEGSFDSRPVKGHLLVKDFDNPIISGEISANVDLSIAQILIPDSLIDELSGNSDLRVKFSGALNDPEDMTYSGEISVTEGGIVSQLIPERLNGITLKAYFDNRLLKINQFTCSSESGGDVKFKGRFTDLVNYLKADSLKREKINPAIEGNFSGDLAISLIEPYLKPKGNPKLSGRAIFDISLTGNLKDSKSIKPIGNLSVTNGAYSDSLLPEPIKSFSLELVIRPDTVSVTDLSLQFLSSDLMLNGKLSDPFPYLLPISHEERATVPSPFLEFSMQSSRINIDRLFPEAIPGGGGDSAKIIQDSISSVILPNFNGRGDVKFDTLIYADVEFTNIKSKVKIKNRKIEVYNAAGSIYSGAVSGQTTIDLNDFNQPRYSGKFLATQIETDDFLSRFTKFGGYLYGKANLEGSYDAVGWEPEQFFNSLTMNGQGDIRDGKLITTGIFYQVLSDLSDRMGYAFSPEQPLNNFTSVIVVKDGRVMLDKMTFALANLGDLSISGYYSFDESLEYKGTLLLSDENSRKLIKSFGSVGSLLKGKNTKRVSIPIVIEGKLSNPKPKLDYMSLKKSLGNNLKEQAGDLLKSLFKKK